MQILKEDKESLERHKPGQNKVRLTFGWVGIIVPTPPTNCNPHGASGNILLIFCCEMRILGRTQSRACHILNLDVKTVWNEAPMVLRQNPLFCIICLTLLA